MYLVKYCWIGTKLKGRRDAEHLMQHWTGSPAADERERPNCGRDWPPTAARRARCASWPRGSPRRWLESRLRPAGVFPWRYRSEGSGDGEQRGQPRCTELWGRPHSNLWKQKSQVLIRYSFKPPPPPPPKKKKNIFRTYRSPESSCMFIYRDANFWKSELGRIFNWQESMRAKRAEFFWGHFSNFCGSAVAIIRAQMWQDICPIKV